MRTITPDPLLATAPPAMRRAAEAFEAQALGQLLQPMFATLNPGHGAFGGGSAEAQWQPMLTDAIASSIARSGGLGIAGMVLREMLRIQSGAQTPPLSTAASPPQPEPPR
jgi:flagellar protein FlgJ